MAFNYEYPYTRPEANADWILHTIKELMNAMDTFTVINSIQWKGEWNITKQYPRWSLVDVDGFGYIAIKDVPAGIEITNSKYWIMVANYSVLYAEMQLRLDALENRTTEAENNITVLKNYSVFVDIKKLGAAGDGVTDDTEVFKNAFSNYKCIYIPEGEYLITETVEIDSNTTVIANGAIIKHNIVRETYSSYGGYYPVFLADGKSNINITGLKFVGNATNETVLNLVSNFVFNLCDLITLRECEFDRTISGIDISLETCTNTIIENCTFKYYKYMGVGIFKSEHCVVNKCTFLDQGLTYDNTYGVAITTHTPFSTTIKCKDIHVTNCYFDYPHTTHTWECIDSHGGRDLYIENNTMYNCRNGILLETSTSREFSNENVYVNGNYIACKSTNAQSIFGILIGGTYLTVTNNTIVSGGRTTATDIAHQQCGGIIVYDKCSNAKISGNKLYGCGCHGISFAMASTNQAETVDVTDNYMTYIVPVNGISSEIYFNNNGANDVYVRNNNFMGSSAGIHISTTNLTIANYPVFEGNKYRYNPIFDNFAKVCPDVIRASDTPIHGRHGAFCRVWNASSAATMFKVYNGSAWV